MQTSLPLIIIKLFAEWNDYSFSCSSEPLRCLRPWLVPSSWVAGTDDQFILNATLFVTLSGSLSVLQLSCLSHMHFVLQVRPTSIPWHFHPQQANTLLTPCSSSLATWLYHLSRLLVTFLDACLTLVLLIMFISYPVLCLYTYRPQQSRSSSHLLLVLLPALSA